MSTKSSFCNVRNRHTFFFTKGGPLERPSRRLLRLRIFGKWTEFVKYHRIWWSNRRKIETWKDDATWYWHELTIWYSFLLLSDFFYINDKCIRKRNVKAGKVRITRCSGQTRKHTPPEKETKLWRASLPCLRYFWYGAILFIYCWCCRNSWTCPKIKQSGFWTLGTGESTAMFVSAHFWPVGDCALVHCQSAVFVMAIAANTVRAFDCSADGHDTTSFK